MPADIPVTIPEPEPTEAMPENPGLLHAPLVELVVNVVVSPGHNEVLPVIAPGTGSTVIVVVAMQPVGSR